jgi:uncharacterized protein YerC
VARVTVAGLRGFTLKTSRRINLLGETGIRAILQDVGREFVASYVAKIRSFTPGEARDLTERYKVAKRKKVGHVYPILIATGAMVASIYSRVYRGPPWSIRIGFAGEHSGGIRNYDLAEIHKRSGRDFTKREKGWSKKWLKEIGTRLRDQR